MARPWLARTGQRGRLVTPALLLLATLAAFARMLSAEPGDPRRGAAVAFLLFAGLTALGLALSVRCPACRRLVVPRAVRAAPVTWPVALLGADRCPACGDPGPRDA